MLFNIFMQAENCYKFSDSPPPAISQKISILQCLLSHCCRQFLFVGKLVL